MGLSIWQILLVLVLVVLLFGRGKISDLMGDVAKGITSFRKGLKEDDTSDSASADGKVIDNETGEPLDVTGKDKAPRSEQ